MGLVYQRVQDGWQGEVGCGGWFGPDSILISQRGRHSLGIDRRDP